MIKPKYLLAFLLATSVFSAPTAARAEIKIGTIDMNLVFKNSSKTKEAEAKMTEARNAAKKEFNERTDAYKKSLEEINQLNKQLEAPALSAEAKTLKAKERDEKIAAIKKLESEINEFGRTREQQLQQQMIRMRDEILKEITELVLARVKSSEVDLVFDKSGASANGFSPLLFSRGSHDFTEEVSAALEKAGPAGRP